MDSREFDSKLKSHKIFSVVKDSLKNDSDNLRNLIEIKDDILYLWHSDENCLLSLNLKKLDDETDDNSYQKLHLLSPPSFSVNRLLSSACSTRICLWGSRGAVVVELPTRWGKGGLFDGGKETILCKSYLVDERFLYSQGEVRRVHWHPESVSHLLVLISDNTIRLYNIALKTGPKIIKIFNLGPKPSGLLAGRKILESLGDTAVDFTPAPDSNALLILRGNGDVYMIQCDLSSKSPIPPKLHGPLTMYPPADDNYGEESCSITALGGVDIPPLVVIATSSAVLYHCLLLPEQNSDDLDESVSKKDDISYALYVVEAVELNIVLSPDNEQLQYNYPVHLYPCSVHSGTYACVHAAGVHTVTLPIVPQLKEYSLTDTGDIENMAHMVCTGGSVARYVVCTHGPRGAFLPPLGIAITQPPLPALLVLCHDGELLTRTIEPFDIEEQLYKELQLKNPALDQDEIDSILKDRQKLSFTSIIQEILTRDVSQPILKLASKEEPTPKESFEFLTQATLKFRQEYISRQMRALQAMIKKLNCLNLLNKQQHEWYADLQKEINEVHNFSKVIQEKCYLAMKYQDDMRSRLSSVTRALRASARATPAERELLRELINYKHTSQLLADSIATLKQRGKHKSKELLTWQEEYKKKDIALGKSHSDTISSVLQQQTSQISNLIEETKLLKDQLSIV